MRVIRLGALLLALLTMAQEHADLSPEQQAEATKIGEAPYIGDALYDAAVRRFDGECNARIQALGRARMQLDWMRRALGNRQADSERAAIDLAESAYRAESARPCTQSAADREFAEAVRLLPEMPIDTSGRDAPGTDYSTRLTTRNAVRDELLNTILGNTDRCDTATALQLLSARRRYVLRLRRNAELARASADPLSPQNREAIDTYFRELGITEAFYEDFMRLRVECDKKRRASRAPVSSPPPLPVRPAPTVVTPPTISTAPVINSGEPSIPPDPCAHPGTAAFAKTCRNAAAILGRWTSRALGGVIETRLDASGRLTGWVITTNRVMTANGYQSGMQIMRGWTIGAPDSVWLASARNGEVYAAKQPDRKPGEPFGDAKWEKYGIINITRSNPDELAMPVLTWRLGNHEPWVRMARSN